MKKTLIVILILFAIWGCSQPKQETEAVIPAKSVNFVEMPNPQLPIVYFEIVIKSGSAADPVGKEGLAWFTAHLLQRGSKNYSREEFENELERIGGRLDIRVDREVIVIRGKTLLENLDSYYALLTDMLQNPVFSEQEAARLRKDQEQALKDVIRDDVRLAGEILIAGLYEGHPYGHPVEGLFSSIAGLKAADAGEFYKTHFVVENILCGLSGNYPPEFAEKFRNDMQKFGTGKVDTSPNVTLPLTKTRVVLVQKDGKDQSQIRMGELVNYDRRDPRWYDFLLANTYLGQHRESFGQLYTTIRSERGMSYGAYSYFEHFQQEGWSKNPMPLTPMSPQYFSMWTYPKWTNTEFAVKMAIYQMNKLLDNGIDSGQLRRFEDYQANSFPFLIETAEQNLARTLEDSYYDQPGFIDNFSSNIYKIETGNLRETLNQSWSSQRLLIVIVAGKTEALKAELLTKQTTLEMPGGATANGLEAVNTEVEALDLELNPEDITIIGAEELFH